MKSVIITTTYKGVFYGQIDPSEMKDTTITLIGAKNVIYWSSETKGFLGLSKDGPNSSCTISSEAGGPIVLHGITSVTECSQEAIEGWKEY